MKKIIYIFLCAALSCSCEGFYGTFDDASQDFVEVAAINRSSIPVNLNIYGTYWAEPQDTIFLKPHNGLWKTEESRENYHGQEILPIQYSVIRADFNNGERVIYFDMYSDLPYNPCAIGAKEVWDDHKQHKIIEFDDKKCESIFTKQDSLHMFDISMYYSPSDAVEDLCVLGSTEGYFTDLVPSGDVKDKLKLGAAVYTEAESIDKVRFVEGLHYEADTLKISSEVQHRYRHRDVYPYYDLEQLRLLGLTNFGCDFAALTGRVDGRFDSFCGIALLEVHVGKTEKICDTEHPEELMTRLENASEPICIIDQIEYGNFMILLAEADCSHMNIHTYVQQKLLREDPSEYYSYDMYYTPEIRFHLITLDGNGELVCQSGGEELAAVFYKGYETPALHPLSYHVSDLKDDTSPVQRIGRYMHLYGGI